ncbi:hypothetical protein A3L09_01640 [Thermococcus profundus]|uniref:Uncharacterized protein n=1 Tax=Thermococcus profundus TaxID=49899 RepID=A0A2Z2MJD0_THEPR|nr:hypothetical protein A3L09_01640 [Thermococcus profundus]
MPLYPSAKTGRFEEEAENKEQGKYQNDPQESTSSKSVRQKKNVAKEHYDEGHEENNEDNLEVFDKGANLPSEPHILENGKRG